MKKCRVVFAGPGRLPIYRSESPPDGSKTSRYCCRARRGFSLVSILFTAAAALLALLLLLGAIAYFYLLAESEPSNRVQLIRTSTVRGIEESTSPSTTVVKVEPSYAPPPPRPSPSNNHNTTTSVEPTSTSSEPSEGSSDEPLYKDIVVSYQPYKPPASSNGDVVTAGFVPHWFREELANTGEERASTPNRFTTTSPVHVSPTLPSAATTKQHYQDTSNSTDGGAMCHSPRLEACRGVLPYDLTTMQTGEIASSTARLEAAAGALGFAHVARGACRLAARQLLCAILEPPCQPDDRVLLPCRAACQAAVSECGEFLLATLGLGSEFDCTRYPDTRDAAVCVDLTGECESPSVRCSSSGACVPSQWRCDTRDDCSDSSDEKNCRTFHAPTIRPSDVSRSTPCKPGQARCLDGACIDSSQLCDGLQHCSRGEDEAVCPPS